MSDEETVFPGTTLNSLFSTIRLPELAKSPSTSDEEEDVNEDECLNEEEKEEAARVRKEQVEADKRCILEEVVRMTLKSVKSQRPPAGSFTPKSRSRLHSFKFPTSEDLSRIAAEQLTQRLGTAKSTEEEEEEEYEPDAEEIAREYRKLFEESDEDDVDEVFEEILKKAEIAFKLEEERNFDELCAKPKRKRNKSAVKERVSKPVQRQLEALKRFKERIAEPKPSNQLVNSSATAAEPAPPVSSSYFALGSRDNIASRNARPYPIWRSTATFTPIFATRSNPNWARRPSPYTGLPLTPTPLPLPRTLNNVYREKRTLRSAFKPASDRFSAPSDRPAILESSSRQPTTAGSSSPNKPLLNSSSTGPPATTCWNTKLLEENSDSPVQKRKSTGSRIMTSPIDENAPSPPSPLVTSTPLRQCSAVETNTLLPRSSAVETTPLPRSSVVRFTDASPQYFPYSSGSSICSEDLVNDMYQVSPPAGYVPERFTNACQQSYFNYVNDDEMHNGRAMPYDTALTYQRSDTIRVLRSSSYHSNVNPNNHPNFLNNFVRNLNANVGNNINMAVEYSMKVKYF